MIKFLKESREELKKVVWPGRDEVLTSTIVVLVTTIIISLFLYGVDSIFETLFNGLVNFRVGG